MPFLFGASMFPFITTHPVIATVISYFLFSNAVEALEPPDALSSKGYRWFFAFSHGFAGNVRYALQKVAPEYVDPSK
jgi:hypothetical protein